MTETRKPVKAWPSDPGPLRKFPVRPGWVASLALRLAKKARGHWDTLAVRYRRLVPRWPEGDGLECLSHPDYVEEDSDRFKEAKAALGRQIAADLFWERAGEQASPPRAVIYIPEEEPE